MTTIVNIQNLEIEETAFPSGLIFTGSGVKAPSGDCPARDNRLIRFLLISLLIHMAALFTAFVFFLDSPESGRGQSFVLVEISGLMAGDGAGVGLSSVKQDKAGSLVKVISAPVIEVRKKESAHLAKKAAIAVRQAKGANEAKEVKAPTPPVTIASYATKSETAVVQESALNKAKGLPDAHPAAIKPTPSPAAAEEKLFSAEDNPSAGIKRPHIKAAEVSAVSYAAPSGPVAGHRAKEGEEAVVGAGGTGQTKGDGGPGRGAMIQGLKPPPYPRFSRLRGEEGAVELQVKVGADGRGAEISLLKSSGYARLDRAALKAVEKARFIPARRNGRSTASKKTVVFVFKLKD